MDKHNQMMEGQTAQTEQMKKEIQIKKEDNDETIKQIEDDARFEKETIVNQNKSNQKQVQEMSLRSKAELMLTNNKLTDLGNDIDQLQRQYQDKNKQYEL
jgi:hypothetical protein